jgi:hypothetical protein
MKLVLDRGICPFLDTYSFVMFRSTCRTHNNDAEAWNLRVSNSLIHLGLTAKQTIGLNYLLGRALVFYSTEITLWLERIIGWVRHKISIRIMYHFISQYYPMFLYSADLSQLSYRQRFIWERLWCRNENLYKTLHLCHDDCNKRRRISCH